MINQTKETLAAHRRGMFCFYLTFALIAIAILNVNLLAFFSIIIAYICGYVSVSCLARVENGDWPLKGQREKWQERRSL